ncbi:MAG: hypothetical protein IPN95_18185 [Bacteroidetes bacterium]|jgi:hypothetical protein|nr:hypothetical protein [Bacteroidota bacterium]
MKSFIKVFAVTLMLAVVAVSCGKVEKILPKKDGMWVGTSQTVVTYVDDSLVSTETDTDSLGKMFFDKEGTGYSVDFQDSNRTDFTWSVNDDNDVITITGTDSGSVAMPYDILESSSKEQKWFGTLSFDIFGIVTKIEITSTMERAE